LKTLELFSGAGGLSLGLATAGFEIVAAVEINRDAMDTYSQHHGSAEHLNVDAAHVDFRRFRSKVDCVVGGPPCQPFSLGGLRKGRSDHRDMIPQFLRCLHEVRPRYFLMENVPGLTLKGARPYFDSVLMLLGELDYTLNYALLNSADYGVPQKRRRLFITGILERRAPLLFPSPSHGPGLAKYVATSEIVSNDHPYGDPPNCPVRYAKYPDLRPNPYAGHIYNGGGRPLDPNGPSHTILASSGGYKTHWVDTLGIAPAYHRHLLDGGAARDGVVPGARRLSVEECALLQTFPRDLAFCGRRSSQYTQVGDAVPPLLAEALGRALISQASGRPGQTQKWVRPQKVELQGCLV
jgi:DNA (cytosine-5)-methyltransferase 1